MGLSFEEQVAAQIQRLRHQPLGVIEAEVAAKRRNWLQRHGRAARPRTARRPVTPRMAFEALFFEYMGLDAADVPVLQADESLIVWSSRNPCPTLEACQQLGLDTRVVCRRSYEKSTQAFVSTLDPQLRFLRDYAEIRPHSHHCLERIERVDFEQMMRIAIQEAKQSRLEGNKGYGAAVALGNRVVACAHDTAATERDPSRHAEVNAIRQAARVLGTGDLCGTILFSTCEPCPMCSSLAVWANMTTLVFGASIEATAARGKARITVSAREIVARSPAMVEVIPGVLEHECLGLYG